eukprot:4064131-Amphidinium_carterae.1
MEVGTVVGAGRTSGSRKFGCAVMVGILTNPSGTHGAGGTGTETLGTYAGAAGTGTQPVRLNAHKLVQIVSDDPPDL